MRYPTEQVDDGVEELRAVAGAIARTHPYAGHRCFTRDELQALAVDEVAGRLRAAGSVARALHGPEGVAGLAICSPLGWDSAYFAMPMARLEFHGLPGVDEESVSRLLGKTLDTAVRQGLRHVCCRVGVDEYALFNALVSLGFRLADVQQVYLVRRNGARTGRGRVIFQPRPYRPVDRDLLLELFSRVRFDTRYTRDADLPEQRTSALYRHWIDGMIDRPEQEREIRVLERDGRVVAAGAGRYLDFAPRGIARKLMTDGIFASLKGYGGAYVGITRAVVEAGWEQGCDVVELKVSASNQAANRVLRYLGYEAVAQSFSLHRFCQEAPR